jgi:spore coat polysaccharide biosynthesis protein SpsF (cytidylyltransferase family)
MTGIFIIARLGSVRLRNKHLIAVAGKTFIEWEIMRLAQAFSSEIENGTGKIVVCTADEEMNKKFVPVIKGASIYFGNVHNIPVRIHECALEHKIDNIVIVDGDDVLVSMQAVRLVFQALTNGKSLVKTSGLPLGMNAFGFHTSELSKVYDWVRDKGILETGWGRFFDESRYTKIDFPAHESADELRFTLDYREDSQFFDEIFKHFKGGIVNAADTEIIDFVVDNELYKLNAAIHKEYWENFHRQIENENAE